MNPWIWRAITCQIYSGCAESLTAELNRAESAGWEVFSVLLRRPDEALVVMRRRPAGGKP